MLTFWTWAMNIIGIICLISAVCSVVMFCEIMKNGRGADRLAWIFAVWIPILGPALFLWLWQREQESRWLEQHSGK